jgi:hypothetical protein
MTLDQLSAAATEGELLPCPFCGGPAEVESKRCGWRVHCIKPSCYTAGPYPDDCTEAEAITAWNQRTGQLVAVADDAVERVARTLAPNLEGGREFDQMPKDRAQLRQWTAQGMCLINDATQDDATWLAQEAIKAAKGTGDE